MQIGELPFPFCSRLLRLFLLLIAFQPIFASCDVLTAGFPPGELQLPPGKLVEGSPGTKLGAVMSCSRIHIHGVSRLRHPNLFFHSLKVKVDLAPAYLNSRIPATEVCFHRNSSIPTGACPPGEWHKLSKGSWTQSTSPFSYRILDIRMHPDLPSSAVQVSTEGEFSPHRAVFLVFGVLLMAFARVLSESVVFYYGGAMTIGIILVFLMILFQGMKLLPTGRKSSFAIFLYSSVVGLATFLLHYLSGLLRSALTELGISEDIHKPLGIFFLLCLFMAGAWLGFWGVRRLILNESGAVDQDVAYFVEWSALIFSAAMILQSSADTLFATEALLLGILVKLNVGSKKKLRLLRRLYRRIHGLFSRTHTKSSPHKSVRRTEATTGLTTTNVSKGDTYYSTFHRTPERRKFSKEEWKVLTRDSTRRAVEELTSSPDFGRWVAANAERITVNPPIDENDAKKSRRFRWF